MGWLGSFEEINIIHCRRKRAKSPIDYCNFSNPTQASMLIHENIFYMQDQQMNENKPQSWQGVHTFTGHTSWVYSVPISPDSQILASVCHNQILIWNLKTGQQINILSGHSDVIFSLVIRGRAEIAIKKCHLP